MKESNDSFLHDLGLYEKPIDEQQLASTDNDRNCLGEIPQSKFHNLLLQSQMKCLSR
jgi:hypothetical protein